MHTPIYLLPQYSIKDHENYTYRWLISANWDIKDSVFEIITQGGGRDRFLSLHDENETFFEEKFDLKGINILDMEIDFPEIENFRGINFKYAYFGASRFKKATFYNSNIEFAVLRDCEFSNCIFTFGSFCSTKFVNTRFIECDFLNIDMTNCVFDNVSFVNCFVPKRLFFECKFNQSTAISFSKEPHRSKATSLNNQDLTEIYKGIKEGYLTGGVIEKSRNYLYKQQQSITRHNTENACCKLKRYFLEILAGYGTSPWRVLCVMLFVYLFFTAVFSIQTSLSDGYLLSAGAFFTFGAKTSLLDGSGVFMKILYIIESFLGLSLIAVFITVLVNYWFQEQ